MSVVAAAALTISELEGLLGKADPAVLFVPPRILRRIIKRDRRLTGLGLQVPHRKSYVIRREALLSIADQGELDVPADRDLPELVLLFPRPDADRLARPREAVLLYYWRLLFHAHVHLALAQRRREGKLTEEVVRDRIRHIGLTELDEARAVLRQERFLLPPGGLLAGASDDFALYDEFTAVYLELRHFDPDRVEAYFPTILGPRAVDAILAQDVDAAALVAATRLEGACLPIQAHAQAAPVAVVALPPRPDSWAYQGLMARAGRAATRGNVVRAAVWHAQAAAATTGAQAEAAQAAAQRDLDDLVDRLQRALGLGDDVAGPWRDAITPLLAPASVGRWAVEARFLYELQKVCIDQEHDVYAADLVEWVVSWGAKPVLRLLPHQKDLLTVRHLRRALHKLTAVRVADVERARLSGLLHGALHRAEHVLRDRLRPSVRDALDGVGLVPGSAAESVSRDKLVEELLDRAIERNFLTMGDLRDALARNRLKLPDLHGPGQFLLGDKLIRANRRLATNLDGIYRRGEIYLRWLQRLSSTAFGTPVGRFLTRYLVFPFGASYMLIKMWEELVGLFRPAKAHALEGAIEAVSEGPEAVSHPHHHGHGLAVNPWVWGGLGIFLFLLLHVPSFRRGVWQAAKLAWQGVRGLFWDLPRAFLRLRWVQAIVQSKPFQLFYQYIFKPLPWAAIAWACLHLAGAPPETSVGTAAVVFILVVVLVHSRLGQYLEEVAADGLVRSWQLIRSDLVPGLVRWVLFVFRRLVENVERLLYTVDEWLRFRTGDSRLSLVFKPVLGLVWFFITYLVRIIINLFVEPTFNPIKHFPVVTVTAKLIVPVYKQLFEQFRGPLEPLLGRAGSGAVAATAIFLLPGLAGFLVWELKENWRLYKANQSPTLDPEIVGHHGETVLRLMRPGLHSGTLPKLYAKLRRAGPRSARRQREALTGVGQSLRHFVERDFLAILNVSKAWSAGPRLEIRAVHAATNRLRIELRASDPGAGSLYLELEEHAGWLVAGLAPRARSESWLGGLNEAQLDAFRDALAGLWKLAGASLVREQVDAALPAGAVWDVTDRGLIVWPGPSAAAEVVYPPASIQDRLFRATPVRWDEWVRTWQAQAAGESASPVVPRSVQLLPG